MIGDLLGRHAVNVLLVECRLLLLARIALSTRESMLTAFQAALNHRRFAGGKLPRIVCSTRRQTVRRLSETESIAVIVCVRPEKTGTEMPPGRRRV